MVDNTTTSPESPPRVPAAGTSLSRFDGLADGAVREVALGDERDPLSLIVVRRGDDVKAFVNVCPHVFLPLTFRSARLLSADGLRLVCSNHFAEFAIDDGRALSGPVAPGCALDRVPVHVSVDGDIVVGEAEAR